MEEKKSIIQDLLPTMIRYKKQLDTRDWARLPPAAQCLLLLILKKAIDTGESRFSLPLTNVKKEISMENKEPEYWEKQAQAISAHIVRSSIVLVEIPSFIGAMTLIRDVGYDSTTRSFVADLKPEFVEFLRDYSEGFTQFPTKSFISIRKKYAMNLYRLFSQNFHGHFEMDFKEFRQAMGYPASIKNNNVCLSVEKAAKELEKKKIYQNIVFEKIFAPCQGRPLQAVRFTYEKTDEQKAYEAGQGTLPGLNEDNEEAAGTTPQVPQAASPDPFPENNEPDMAHPPTSEEVEAALAEIQPPAAKKKPEKKEAAPAPKCPRCGKPMVVRKNGQGEKFWGCPDFPKCRGSLDYEEEE